MPVTGSGQIGIVSDIVAEFGGTAPHNLDEYYNGGGLVPNTAANALVPASGEIQITDFYASTKFDMEENQITVTITSTVNDPSAAEVSLRFYADGDHDYHKNPDGADTENGSWSNVEEAGYGADYEVMLTVTSGDSPTTGAIGSWLELSTSPRNWVMLQSSIGTKSGVWRLQVRNKTSVTVGFDVSYTMTSTVDP